MALPVLTLSSGMLAGLGTTLNLVGVPAIRASTDPLPSWQVAYTNGKAMAVTNIAIATAAGIKGYLDSGPTKDTRFLAVAGMSSAIAVFTIFFMTRTNNALYAIKMESRQDEDSKVRKLIGKWNRLQLVRTLLGIGAFATSIYINYK